jgi:hypothetical protein
MMIGENAAFLEKSLAKNFIQEKNKGALFSKRPFISVFN